jgi:DNA mismatch repair protein MutL
VEGSEAEFELLQAHGEVLGRLGIKISRMGPRAIGIQAVPTFMQGGDAAEFLRDVLDWAARLDKSPDLETATDDIAHLLACHDSVKAGRRLSAEEIASLLQQANLVERASRCPHGRPTTLRFTKADLEKQFGRR